jgi:hypothetical protein
MNRNLAERVGALEGRVDRMENQLTALETSLRTELDSLGRYSTRTRDELIQAQGKIEGVLGALEAVVSHGENQQGTVEAAALLRRARNNLTRVNRHLKAV